MKAPALRFSGDRNMPTENIDRYKLLRSQYLRHNVDGKHSMGFQGEPSVFKFLRRKVNGP